MTISSEQAFAILHNLDVAEPLRKYQPQHAMVAVDEDGAIVGIEKFKHHPSWDEQDKVFAQYKGTAIFFADIETYPILEKFERKVLACRDAYRNRHVSRANRGKGLIGDTYYGGLERE